MTNHQQTLAAVLAGAGTLAVIGVGACQYIQGDILRVSSEHGQIRTDMNDQHTQIREDMRTQHSEIGDDMRTQHSEIGDDIRQILNRLPGPTQPSGDVPSFLVDPNGRIRNEFMTSLPPSPGGAIPMDRDDIAGVVTGPDGPEAGVWVIAETRDLPTRHAKIVVTDDAGRYLLPDLPATTYDVWVRGYGLVDSDKVQAEPGARLDLTSVPAPNVAAAAEYYPAQDWFALLEVPGPDEFPGTGSDGNGISPDIESQGEWIRSAVNTDGCTGCHALGNKATREIPDALGNFDSHFAAWDRRVQSGQAGATMDARLAAVGRPRALEMFADWTDRIQAGEYPLTAPPRPQGVERNVVVTMWDWSDPEAYMHDLISADKRDPTVNANGPVYGAPENSTDDMPVVDPNTHVASVVPLQVRDADTPSSAATLPKMPSPYWGEEVIWHSRSVAHSFAMDSRARVWIAARVRAAETPAFCQPGSSHPSAQAFPIERSNRQVQMYDPETGRSPPSPPASGRTT